MLEKIIKSAEYLKNKNINNVDIVIVLGTGLSSLIDDVEVLEKIPYKDIPFFPESTVLSHKNELIYFRYTDKYVLAMAGRFHYYEGYDFQQLTFPLRVLLYMKPKTLIVSNAAGGVNPSYSSGDIMIINDHINLMPGNPLRGKNEDSLGPRFPSMQNAYEIKYIDLINKIANEKNIKIHNGVYCALQGPSLETNAEYKMIRIIGADAVGMSTVPEVIVARHMNIPVLGISVITNVNHENQKDDISHEEVIVNAQKNETALKILIEEFIKRVGSE